MDATGRIMMTHANEAMQAGENRNVILPLDGLRNGSYVMSILRDGIIVSTERVIIAR
jgi:hypothetical protein